MRSSVRLAFQAPAVFGLLALLAAAPALAQEDREPQGDRPGSDALLLPRGVSLPTDAAATAKLDAARDYIASRDWPQATRTLQGLLDAPEDFLVPARSGAGWRGARLEADRLLGTLPVAGREFYEQTYGPQARALLSEARSRNDLALLAEVARRFLHTRAGVEALRLLGTHYLDRDRPLMAALCFGQLLDRVSADRLPPAALLAAALAFQHAGETGRAEQAWKQLAVTAPQGLRLGGRVLSLAELRREAPRARPLPEAGFALHADTSVLKIDWKQPTAREPATQDWLQAALRQQENRTRPILPALYPLVSRDRVVYRSHRGVEAVDLRTGRSLWEAPSEGALDQAIHDLATFPHVASWVNGYVRSNPHVLFENSVLGALTTDGARVFAVEDLAVPPFPGSTATPAGRRGAIPQLTVAPELSDAAQHSRLMALDLETGKLLWEQGARGDVLHDGYFLGPPLPLDGQLFGLFEKDQELRLVCLDPVRGRLTWMQTLAVAPNRLLLDPCRRLEAASFAYADGVLVCPTHAGVVVGVDLLSRRLLWAHVYERETPPLAERPGWGRRGRSWSSAPPQLWSERKGSPPIIRDGRVVVTAPDSTSIHCLSLRDGSLLWKAERAEGELYLAGVSDGRVVLVGRENVRALRLEDGRQLWQVETGMPSGRGVFRRGGYLLPLASAAAEKGPIVCLLDLEKGTVVARFPWPAAEGPGNLLLQEGAVLSQTVTTMTLHRVSDFSRKK